MSKQFLIGLAVLAAVVVGFLAFGGSDDPVTIVQRAGAPGVERDGEGGADEDVGAGPPGSLHLGGESRGADPEGKGGAPDQANRAGAGGAERQVAGPGGAAGVAGSRGQSLDEDAGARRPEVRSRLSETGGLAETTGEAIRRGGGVTARAPADDWPEEAVDVVDPADQREPDAGEVLTLFEGDPAVSQAEAVVEDEVVIDEDGGSFNADSEYAVPMAGRMGGESGTISFWVRPDGETSDIDNASLVQLRSQNEWANRLQIWKDGSNIRLVFSDGGGIESGASYGSDAWAPDEWRMVTATWGDGMTALYVNGQLAGTSQYETPFTILPKTMLHVASNYRDDPRSLTGDVNQFRVYNRVLSPDEVSSLSSLYPE